MNVLLKICGSTFFKTTDIKPSWWAMNDIWNIIIAKKYTNINKLQILYNSFLGEYNIFSKLSVAP